MNRRVLILSAACILVAVGAGGYFFWKWKTRPAPKKAAASEAKPLPPGTVVSFQTTVRAVNVVPVDAPVDGILQEFPVKPGDEVVEGQILGSVNNEVLAEHEREAANELERVKTRMTTLESQLLAARLEESRQSADASRAASDRQRTERTFQRQQMLFREGATPRRTFESSQAAYEAAKAEEASLTALAKSLRDRVDQITKDLDAAKKLVSETEAAYDAAKAGLAAAQLLSPVDGVIISISKQAGDEVKAGMEGLIQIAVDLTAMEAVIDVEPPLVPRIQPGMTAEVYFADLATSLPGLVRSTGDGKAHVEFASPTPEIRPGMQATIKIALR